MAPSGEGGKVVRTVAVRGSPSDRSPRSSRRRAMASFRSLKIFHYSIRWSEMRDSETTPQPGEVVKLLPSQQWAIWLALEQDAQGSAALALVREDDSLKLELTSLARLGGLDKIARKGFLRPPLTRLAAGTLLHYNMQGIPTLILAASQGILEVPMIQHVHDGSLLSYTDVVASPSDEITLVGADRVLLREHAMKERVEEADAFINHIESALHGASIWRELCACPVI